jgi:hypothetical protein
MNRSRGNVRRDREVSVALEEYRQIEAEKRVVAQELLAVTGLLLAAVAAIAANVKADDLLPLVVVAPAVLVAGWVGAILKVYADEYVVYLSVVEERLRELCGSPTPVMGWNTIWSRAGTLSTIRGARRVASIVPLLSAAIVIAVAAVVAGLYAITNSAPINGWPFQARVAACVAYAFLNGGLGLMIGFAWFRGVARLKSSEATFRQHLLTGRPAPDGLGDADHPLSSRS